MNLKWMAVLGLVLMAASVNAGEPGTLTASKDKVSYGIGVDVARNFQRLGLDLDLDLLIKAMRDVYGGGKLLMTEEELRATMDAYRIELQSRQLDAMKKAGEENQKKGEAFLAENKGKEGVVVLPSGLQYKVLNAANGKTPQDADTVECNYRGALIDGTEFDSSYRRGQPATFSVTGVIPGWREALKLMPVGSKWQLFVPPQLAYGPRGAGRDIGPNATLVFEVELLAIK